MATSATQWGITWTWAEDLTVGQYANGDYYVVAPSGLTLTATSPASTTDGGGRTINGTMLNPVGNENTVPQGFDSGMTSNSYLATKNIARPGNLPLLVASGSSLVSCISHPVAGTRPQITTGAILTVVASAPAVGSLRPPYCGTDKTSYWTKDDLDYSILSSLASVGTHVDMATAADYFARAWFEINTSWTGRFMHPSENQPDYGEDIAIRLGTGLMMLCLDYTNEEKETLYIRMVQYGIDIYGAAKTGGLWADLGGHNQGRAMPMLLAGLALNDSDILFYSAPAQLKFQENRQTFIVNEAQLTVVPYYGDDRERQPYGIQTSAVTFDPATDRVMWPGHSFFDTTPIIFTTTGALAAPLVAEQTYLVRGETVTITTASPAVVTWTGHGLSAGDSVRFTVAATTGDLPTPMAQNSVYYVLASGLTANTFQFSTTPGGTAFNTTAPGDDPLTGLSNSYFKLAAIYKGAYVDLTTTGSGTNTGVFNLLNIAEWGEQHTRAITRDGANWNVNYRGNNYESTLAHCLMARLTIGALPTWNWPPFFAYHDRARLISPTADYPSFHNAMWVAYRDIFNPPDSPTGLTATTVSSSRIDLGWSDNSGDEDGFSIEWSLDGISFTELATVGAGVTTYSATGLSAAVTYYFRVRAFKNLGGYSDEYTNIDSDTTTIPPLTAGQPGTAGLMMSS